jgi:aspartate/methionine/tyrosine aminotransferase
MNDSTAKKKPMDPALRESLQARYREFQAGKMALDMTRGKPCPDQLDLSLGLLNCLRDGDYRAADGSDCRNYGGLDGIPETKALFAEYMGVAPDEIVIGGNSSLTMMHDAMTWAYVFGTAAGAPPWRAQGPVKFLCPSPGYDRHFSICEHLGTEMIPVPMLAEGPDMDAVEALAAGDAAVKGIWCVPKYSNPTGAVYAADVVERLAGLPAKAPDFLIFWDNAYAFHHLGGGPDPLADILGACKRSGHPERALLFGSTSKISLAGSGLAFMAGSRASMAWARSHLAFQTIGPDKLNQKRHAVFFKSLAGIESHMRKHAAILKPKFDAVLEILESELGGKKVAEWTRPKGGYFISVNTPDGCARRVVQRASEAGVKLTPAGSTYPYGNDPRDRNIRVAPSFPALADIRTATQVLAVCIQLESLQPERG